MLCRLTSRARVRAVHDFRQFRHAHLGVNLCAARMFVSEQHLHRAQVGTAVQQVGSEAMAQHVRCDGVTDACSSLFISFHPLPAHPPSDT